MEILYALDKSGKTRYWKIEVEDLPHGVFITRKYGQVGGKETTTSTEITSGKNIGRSNETSKLDQAISEAKSTWKKQYESGYTPDQESLKTNLILLPMLANKWEDRMNYISEPFFVQPKLDGVRMTVGVHKGKFIMFSRTGKEVKMPHIEKELRPLLKEGEFLDGENYTPDKTFEEITGMCRTVLETPTELSSIKFHVFDCFDLGNMNVPFEIRQTSLTKFRNLKYVTFVPTLIVQKKSELNRHHDEFVKYGYEGIMIRDFKGLYKLNERSNHLLKFKAFQTEEYQITGAEEGKGKDLGTVIWRCKGSKGEFSVRPKGTLAQRTEWFKNSKKYIGKQLTVQYQNLTNGGIPRFPVGIAIRDYE
jgi:DNA ligase-1